MKAVSTICSKHKDVNTELLPARLRYISPHIKNVGKIAQELKLPLFILSGKYGLISGEEMIPNYNYYLEEDKIDSLAYIIANQLRQQNITELNFYAEAKPGWTPYIVAIQKGSALANTKLVQIQL